MQLGSHRWSKNTKLYCNSRPQHQRKRDQSRRICLEEDRIEENPLAGNQY